MRPSEPQHGDRMYCGPRKCRCDICRAAHSAKAKEIRAMRKQMLDADPGIRQHGIRSTYTNWGCRCEACIAASRHAQRESAAAKLIAVRRRWLLTELGRPRVDEGILNAESIQRETPT